jgi:hypothetical protein
VISRREWLVGVGGVAALTAASLLVATDPLPARKSIRGFGHPSFGADPAHTDRPEGPGFVRYEDLYRSGDTVTAALARLGVAATVTFPAGDFYESDFDEGYLCAINVPNKSPIRGIWGAGCGDYTHTRDGTYFGIRALTSTKANQIGATANMRVLMAANCPGQSFGQFAVLGSEQGHVFHGFSIYQPNGRCSVTDVLVAGWSGTGNAPPAETSGFTIIDGPRKFDHHMMRVEADGRRPDGLRYGAGPLGGQNLDGTLWEDCYAHDCLASQFGFFQSRRGVLNRCHSENNGTGPGSRSGQGFNFEACDGFVLNDPVIYVDRTDGNTGVHITSSSDGQSGYAPYSLTINNPTFNSLAGLDANTLYAQSWTAGTPAPIVNNAHGQAVDFNWTHP